MAIETRFTQKLIQMIPHLTKPQQTMGAFVLEHPFKVAVYSIEEFAQAVGTSTASANRFAKALGYSGYAPFRQDLIKGFESILDPVHRLKDGQKTAHSIYQVFTQALSEAEGNLTCTRQHLNHKSCEKAVRLILEARRIFILGFGSSAYLSGIMERRLLPYKEMVLSLSNLGGTAEAARRLTFCHENDLIIAISFPRYLPDTLRLADNAVRKGAKVLALTDKLTAPIVPVAHCVLYAKSNTQFGQNSEASTLALIEGLMAAVDYSSEQAVEFAAEMAQTLTPWLVQPHSP